ncbi:MAG: FliI/YscN family ATPase [Planctomycetes bacterium]|nr:FliI/YscN family ATPase [Planctomycetota bacterium]
MTNLFQPQIDLVEALETVRSEGEVSQVVGLVAECRGLAAPVGAVCRIDARGGARQAEVIGFRDSRAILSPFGGVLGIEAGDRVRLDSFRQEVPVGPGLLGRVLDGWGSPVDGKGPVPVERWTDLHRGAPPALSRSRITRPLSTGVRSIDGFSTIGRGQRMGIFAGSGVGKSVLLGMIARYTSADVSVIGLVGERGREVREFLERDLGPEGLARSVVVIATGDESPSLRVKAAFTATAIAEYFREQGRDVLLLMDSITRLAFAQRELGLSAGEPPATRGYPPSVFNMFPRLLERAGRNSTGSITGLYTVLVEGDDIADPIADTVRSVLDGHVWLSRRLATRGHWPSVDVLDSVSRVMIDVTDADHQTRAAKLRELLAVYRESEDLITVGAYVRGANPTLDLAVDMKGRIDEFLRQGIAERSTYEETTLWLAGLADEATGGGPKTERVQKR